MMNFINVVYEIFHQGNKILHCDETINFIQIHEDDDFDEYPFFR